jgi:predicted AAA+ superfamily ATPase
MKRKISDSLVNWKNSKNRKPLILNGARQVGKTYILQDFGRNNFENVVEVNFEIDKPLCEFLESDINPFKIIQYLELTSGKIILAGKTLIIFDEIQACNRALTSLKYFCEQAPDYHIIAAGSLLGVAVNREKYSFPVGKVDELKMFPMDFEEFLWAMGKTLLADIIRENYTGNQVMQESMHHLAIELFLKYFIVGGMPEAVEKFAETESYIRVQQIQNNILNEYIADMAKYADPPTSIKIRACFDSIPAQLAKDNTKFQYKVVQRGGTSTIFGEAIEWLVYAGIAMKCQNIEHGYIPIKAYADLSNFKLYMGDIGLLTLRSMMPLQTILSPFSESNTFLGAMTENYVAQVLTSKEIPVFYWNSQGKAEIDFVLQDGSSVIPIEVKSGVRVRSRSLGVFMERYKSPYGIRISKKNFGFENNIKLLATKPARNTISSRTSLVCCSLTQR